MKTRYATFGHGHMHGHKIFWDRDIVAEIRSPDPAGVMRYWFGEKWCTTYKPSDLDLSLFPRGVQPLEAPYIVGPVLVMRDGQRLIGKAGMTHMGLLYGEGAEQKYHLQDIRARVFITSDRKLVDRKEAAHIAYLAGQVDTPISALYSEDLTEYSNPFKD